MYFIYFIEYQIKNFIHLFYLHLHQLQVSFPLVFEQHHLLHQFFAITHLIIFPHFLQAFLIIVAQVLHLILHLIAVRLEFIPILPFPFTPVIDHLLKPNHHPQHIRDLDHFSYYQRYNHQHIFIPNFGIVIPLMISYLVAFQLFAFYIFNGIPNQYQGPSFIRLLIYRIIFWRRRDFPFRFFQFLFFVHPYLNWLDHLL